MAISICMVALGENAELSEAGIPKAWATRWPRSPQPTDGEKKDITLAYRVGAFQVIYGLIAGAHSVDRCRTALRPGRLLGV